MSDAIRRHSRGRPVSCKRFSYEPVQPGPRTRARCCPSAASCASTALDATCPESCGCHLPAHIWANCQVSRDLAISQRCGQEGGQVSREWPIRRLARANGRPRGGGRSVSHWTWALALVGLVDWRPDRSRPFAGRTDGRSHDRAIVARRSSCRFRITRLAICSTRRRWDRPVPAISSAVPESHLVPARTDTWRRRRGTCAGRH